MLAGAFQSSVGPRLLRYALIGAMATPRVDAYVEMEFVGQGQGWTDVTTDVAFTGWDHRSRALGNHAIRPLREDGHVEVRDAERSARVRPASSAPTARTT
jgi:hypothetical protein